MSVFRIQQTVCIQKNIQSKKKYYWRHRVIIYILKLNKYLCFILKIMYQSDTWSWSSSDLWFFVHYVGYSILYPDLTSTPPNSSPSNARSRSLNSSTYLYCFSQSQYNVKIWHSCVNGVSESPDRAGLSGHYTALLTAYKYTGGNAFNTEQMVGPSGCLVKMDEMDPKSATVWWIDFWLSGRW